MMPEETEELEEAPLSYCGTPLIAYEEDSFPSRKKITIEEQVVRDAQGRQRFHGAFTGGFSAGFFNTVGSLEGWNPREFKSSRQEKADGVLQKPEDFMDEEDVGEFGFAPLKIKAKKEYAMKELREIEVELNGTIPGESALKTIISNSRETVRDLLIRNANFTERIQKHQEYVTQMRIYGCVMPSLKEIPESIQNREYQIPDLFKQNLEKPKCNTSGLGHMNLEGLHTAKTLLQNSFVVKDSNNKKFTIRGQAFGVGAFEQEDEDIYSKEDMSNYDFELTREKEAATKTTPDNNSTLELELFIPATSSLTIIDKHKYLPPAIDQRPSPGRVRKSRFEPLKKESSFVDPSKSSFEPVDSPAINKPRRGLDPIIRAKYLGEKVPETFTSSKDHDPNDLLSVKDQSAGSSSITSGFDFVDRFVSSAASENVHDILEEVKPTKMEYGSEEMRAAARMKMFGGLTRQSVEWHPSQMLCKRFNVAEPSTEESETSAAKRKLTREVIFHLKQNETDQVDVDVESKSIEVTQKKIKLEEAEITDATDVVDTIEVVNEYKKEEGEVEVENEKCILDHKALVDIEDKIEVEKSISLYEAVFGNCSESEEEEKEDEETKARKFKDNMFELVESLSSERIRNPSRPNVAIQMVIKNDEESTLKNSPRFPVNGKLLNGLSNKPLYGPSLPPSAMIETPPTSSENVLNGDLNPDHNEGDWIEKEELKKWAKVRKKEKKKKIKSAKSRRRPKK